MVKRPLKSLLLLASSRDVTETDEALLQRARDMASHKLGPAITAKEADPSRIALATAPNGARQAFIPAWDDTAWDWHRKRGGVAYSNHNCPEHVRPIFEADQATVKSAT